MSVQVTSIEAYVEVNTTEAVVNIVPIGEQGIQGDPGEGVPVGGTTGQVLAKASNTNYDTEWVTGGSGGGGVQSVTGDGVDNTDPNNPALTFPTPAQIGAETAWVTTTADTGELTGTNVIWLADTTSARNRTLDASGVRLQVKDVTGSAGTNNITLTAPSGQTINGNATETIDVNYGWVEYVRSGTNWVTIGGQ